MKRPEVLSKIEELTGIKTNNGNVRIVIDNTMGVFESEIKKGTDFYFIPLVKIGKGSNPDVLYHNQIEIWKLSADKMLNYDSNPGVTIKQTASYTKYIFPMSEAEVLYPVPTGRDLMEERYGDDLDGEFKEISNIDVSHNNGTLTDRDRVCIELGVPSADTPWVNDVIKKAQKQKIKILTILLNKL